MVLIRTISTVSIFFKSPRCPGSGVRRVGFFFREGLLFAACVATCCATIGSHDHTASVNTSPRFVPAHPPCCVACPIIGARPYIRVCTVRHVGLIPLRLPLLCALVGVPVTATVFRSHTSHNEERRQGHAAFSYPCWEGSWCHWRLGCYSWCRVGHCQQRVQWCVWRRCRWHSGGEPRSP